MVLLAVEVHALQLLLAAGSIDSSNNNLLDVRVSSTTTTTARGQDGPLDACEGVAEVFAEDDAQGGRRGADDAEG